MDYGMIIAERENKTVYKCGDKTIKVFAENHPKSFVMNEALNQAVIEEQGMNVPRILEIGRQNGKWVTVSEYIEGETLSELMKKYPEKEDEYLEMFTALQVEIHSKTTTDLTALKDKLHFQIKVADLPATVRYDLHMRLEKMPKHHKICHGDFNPSNVILGNDGKLYILDWSHATQGNASGDAAMTYLLFLLGGKPDLAEKYMRLFCEKSGLEEDTVKRWIPMVAASHSTECQEGETEKLLAWVEEYLV